MNWSITNKHLRWYAPNQTLISSIAPPFQIHNLNEKIKAAEAGGGGQQKASATVMCISSVEVCEAPPEPQQELANKQSTMLRQVKQLEEELAYLHEQLARKDEQLASARTTIQQLRVQASSQDEVLGLRGEINRLLQAQAHLKNDNDKLRAQVTRLKANVTAYQEQNQALGEQLEQCVLELQALQADKDAVEQKNEQLLVELQSMQGAFANLNRECFIKSKELHDTKSSKNQVCAESRNIIENVRSWLQEQKKLNDRLNEKMKEKNVMIHKLKQQYE